MKAGWRQTGIFPLDRSKHPNDTLANREEVEVPDVPCTPVRCNTCGRRSNPLVEQGLVDENFQDILQPPAMSVKPKNRRSQISEGTLITGKYMAENIVNETF